MPFFPSPPLPPRPFPVRPAEATPPPRAARGSAALRGRAPRRGPILVTGLVGAALLLTSCTRGAAKAEIERDLRTALHAGDERAVAAAAQRWRVFLGPQAGQPEGGPPPRVAAAVAARAPRPTLAQVRTYWQDRHAQARRTIDDYLRLVATPTQLPAGLRVPATYVLALAALAGTDELPPAELRAEVARVATALRAVQRPDGLFPFPDLRQQAAATGRLVERLLQRHPEALRAGWLVSDGGGGDLQYDHGLCGAALVAAYQVTGEAQLLAAARRAEDWLRGQPIVPNWNYNAFSVWFLARLARATGDATTLAAAVRRCRLGMLPGQMENGRWLDPHNAKLVYHAILGRALVALVAAQEAVGPPADPALRLASRRALDAAAEEILREGVSVVTVPTEWFADALREGPPVPAWEQALDRLARVAFQPELSRQAHSDVGWYAASYLAYRRLHP